MASSVRSRQLLPRRANVADRLEEPAVVEPVDPFEVGELDGFEIAPRPASVDQLGFDEAVDRLGEGILVGIPDMPTEGSMPASASRSV
jgi:hypothetical protein